MRTVDRPLEKEEYRYCQVRFYEREFLANDDEPSRFLQHWSGRIEWANPEDYDDKVIIGTFSLYLIDLVGALTERESFYNVFDTSQTTFDVYEALYDHDTDELRDGVKEAAFGNDYALSSSVLLLERLVILPVHRGHSIGLVAMKTLVEQFRSAAGIAILKVFPLQLEGSPGDDHETEIPRSTLALDSFTLSARTATARLKRHYERLGFTPVPRTDYMVLDPSFPLPEYGLLVSPPIAVVPKKRSKAKRPKLALVTNK